MSKHCIVVWWDSRQAVTTCSGGSFFILHAPHVFIIIWQTQNQFLHKNLLRACETWLSSYFLAMASLPLLHLRYRDIYVSCCFLSCQTHGFFIPTLGPVLITIPSTILVLKTPTDLSDLDIGSHGNAGEIMVSINDRGYINQENLNMLIYTPSFY